MEVTRLQYVTTISEAQTAILDWLQATEEFHANYNRISQILRDQTSANPPGLTRSRVSTLLKLRQHMSVVLETLLIDMNKPTLAPEYDTNVVLPSKTGHLVIHTRLLKDISRKINKELAQHSVLQA